MDLRRLVLGEFASHTNLHKLRKYPTLTKPSALYWQGSCRKARQTRQYLSTLPAKLGNSDSSVEHVATFWQDCSANLGGHGRPPYLTTLSAITVLRPCVGLTLLRGTLATFAELLSHHYAFPSHYRSCRYVDASCHILWPTHRRGEREHYTQNPLYE